MHYMYITDHACFVSHGHQLLKIFIDRIKRFLLSGASATVVRVSGLQDVYNTAVLSGRTTHTHTHTQMKHWYYNYAPHSAIL